MPTIDQLAPATAASDDDELIVSQAGTARKVTRGQVIDGLQPEIALSSGNLLGRSSVGTGSPEQVTIGANLVLSNGTLTADAAPYEISQLPAGTVPVGSDLIGIAQGGTNTGISYAQFLSGIPAVANIDASRLLVTPSGGTNSQTLAAFAAASLAKSGGTMTGQLILPDDPTVALAAATKQYVDGHVQTSLPLAGGSLSGALTLPTDPTLPSQAATKHYVDAQVGTALSLAGGTLSGSLTLHSDPAAALQASTKQYVDAHVGGTLPLTGGALSGPLVLPSGPTAPFQAATKQYVDTQVEGALPLTGGTLSGPLTLPASPTAPLQAATKNYVDGQIADTVSLNGGTLVGPLTLAADPVSILQPTTKRYVDGLGVSLAASAAKGDGVTDDTAALNAFLAGFASGQRVLIPSGKFYLVNSGDLIVPSGVSIEGTAPLANQANGALFTGCGFYLNPAHSIVLGYAAQLRNLKVLRNGLLSNPTAGQVNSAVSVWATEALSLVTNAAAAVGTDVLTFASTNGLMPGMVIYGKGILPGTTVLSVSSGTVTLSRSIGGASVGNGQSVRFGASIGVLIGPNLGNNVIEDLQIIGFHTGILAMSGEFYASRVQADCITVLEGTWAGDNAYLRDFHCVPYYGITQGNSGNCWRRPGPAFYLHDQTDGWVLDNFFALHWQTGFQLSNVGSVTLRRCGYERLNDGWAGTTGFLWQGKEASCQCFDGYSNGAAVGLDMQQTGEVQIAGMSTVGPIDGTGIAHYRLGTSSWGTICNPMINEAGPTTPVLVQASVIRWKIIAPFIDNGNVSPWISIDPSSVGAVDLFMVRDTANASSAATESHLHEKVWITTDPSIVTTDGSPQTTLALEATTPGTGAVKHAQLFRGGAAVGSLQSVPQGAIQPGIALAADAANGSIILTPNGTFGAFVLGPVPNGLMDGGNSRNGGAVDLQMFRNQPTQVASGGFSTVLGGFGNTASGPWSLAGGSFSVASGQVAVALGFANQISGNGSSAPGGANANDRGRTGVMIWSSDATVPSGYRQKSTQILGTFTADATPTRLTADSAVPGSANTVNLQDWTLYALRLVVAGRHFQAPDAAVWVLDGLLLHRGGGATSVTLTGGGNSIPPSKAIGSGANWAINVSGDTANGGLNVTVVGAAGFPLRWTATVDATEVG